MAQSILSNTAVAAAGRIVNALLGLLATALLTRLLGPASFGAYTLLFSYGALLHLAADFGLYLTLTREIAASREEQHHVFAHVVSLRLVLVTVSLVVGTVISYVVPGLRPLLPAFVLMGLGLAFQSVSQLLMGIFQHYSVVWRATVGDLVGRGTQIGAILLFASTSHSVLAMVAAFAVGAGAALIVHQQLLPRALALRLSFSWGAWKRLLRISWPLGAMLVLNAIYFRVDTLVLSIFRSASEVGHYGLAYRLIESGLFFPAMFGGLLLPRLTEAWHGRKLARCRALLTESIHLTMVAVGFLVVVVYLAAPEFTVWLAGESFRPTVPLLRYLSLALAIMFFGNIFGFTLVALERQYVLLRLYAVLALANTGLNFLFIPAGGAVAAALTTIATEGAAMLVAGIVVWRMVHFAFPARVAGTVLLSGGLALLVGSLLDSALTVIPQLVLVSGIYIAGNVMAGNVAKKHFTLLLRSPLHLT